MKVNFQAWASNYLLANPNPNPKLNPNLRQIQIIFMTVLTLILVSSGILLSVEAPKRKELI